MTSRLDRLFILLETGTNSITKRAAAQQLGEAQRLHPHELHHLLARVSKLLKSSQWDTRIFAAQAVKAILSQVPTWDPEPIETKIKEEDDDQKLMIDNQRTRFEDFDMHNILAESGYLAGSEGNEYDLVAAEGENQNQDEKVLADNLGIHPKLMGFNASDLFSSEDLKNSKSQDSSVSYFNKAVVEDTLNESCGLSRREMNRAKRKARQSSSKQNLNNESDEVAHSSNSVDENFEPQNKKIKIKEDSISSWYNSTTGTVIDPRCTVPDGTGCWPETAVEWPLAAFAQSLLTDLFSQKWEVRHGAATALREFIKIHGKGAGKSKNQTAKELEDSHRFWLVSAALRILYVLGLDRFGDYISDQVVAPVRETCAQALGSLVLLITGSKSKQDSINRVDKSHSDILGIVSVILKLMNNEEWEARHGGLLALKYLLAVRDDLLDEILPVFLPAIKKGFDDPVEDVGATAASTLIPVASHLPRLLKPADLESIVERLWQLLKEQDDLAAACNSFMGLLASILSLPDAKAVLSPQPLSQVLPRLWPFLSHSSSNVRKATLQTLETLTQIDNCSLNPKQQWVEGEGIVLQEALRNVFQRILIEHVPEIQHIAERVWRNLIINSDLELLLHAACPLVSTWLCLAMQPEHVPFNSNLLINVNAYKSKHSNSQNSGSNSGNHELSADHVIKPNSEFKVYIGGIETVTQSVRHANVVRARCMAARALGLLSKYVVMPAPGVLYAADTPSPSLCYAKVLLAHLNSRSALQRILVGLTMAHWAILEMPNPPQIPEILRDRMFSCLHECSYYDEVAPLVTRLLHEYNDYIATLKHYKLYQQAEINAGVMTLQQISEFSAKPIPGLNQPVTNSSLQTVDKTLKLKPKLIDSLEERKRTLGTGAKTTDAQQQILHVTAMAALAGAATMLHCLPLPPQPLNPIIKPLMESIKREEEEELQKLSAKNLAHLVDFCVDRNPCPNNKIIKNLCTFLCTDLEFTPRVNLSEPNIDAFNGILTLTCRQKNAERIIYRGSGNGIGGSRGPGRPPATDIPLEELLACEEPEAKAASVRRRGATIALTEMAILFREKLPQKLPHLWELMIPDILKNYTESKGRQISIEDANDGIVFSLQILETISPNLHSSLLPPILENLKNICSLLANPYKTVRHMAARCIAVLAKLNVKETMGQVVHKIISLLESNTNDKITDPMECDAQRQGAAEALTCLVDSLGVEIVPYAVLFMVPLLGRMSDQIQAVRLACSSTFATLVQLLPLDPGALADPPNLVKEKAQERLFLEQLLNPRTIPDTKLTIPVAAELRSYQQQGLNWLDFLNRYKLHGILCDDMGLGKTLQTLCILAIDHNRIKSAPSSLVVCPPTLTGHWMYEAEKFFNFNDLSVTLYMGNPIERERLRSRVTQFKLIVASYDIVRKDIDFFESLQWNYCVLDEGHIIKNGKTKNAKCIKRIRAHHRLILSGTPVQNDVLELWSLFDFLMPGFLGTEKQFAAKYSKPILACRETKAGSKEQEGGALAMEALHRQVLPFLLRRNKEDVLKDLPPKITQDYYCELSSLQKTLYEDFHSKHSAMLMNNSSQRGHVFEALRYLRNVCNHPKLVLSNKHPQYQVVMNMLEQQRSSLANIDHGAKLPALKQLLLDCGIGQQQQQMQAARGSSSADSRLDQVPQSTQLVSQHRALIFCQLKAMLDIVENDLLKVHLPTVTYSRLDGSVPATQRHSIVAKFNSDPSIDVLLLTTQVGGLGLNLTGADTVIFVEHDWNPMKDLQAMDRAHRIGQKKVVNVYRLITRCTVEEKIMGLQKFKLKTANTVISTDNASLETMGTEQLLDLFALDQGKNTRKEASVGDQEAKVPGSSGFNKAILEILPELWEQQQYDDEYNIDSFLSNLKGSNV